MATTVADIASALGISVQRSLELLDMHGIFVSNPNRPLTSEQVKKINIVIENTKKNHVDNRQTQDKNLRRLAHYVKKYKIFIDTCSLLYFKCDDLLEKIVPLLKEKGGKIIITTRVIDELEKHKNNTVDKELSAKAQDAYKNLLKLQRKGLIEIRGEESDNFADNVFQVVFTKFRLNYKLLLITQDVKLARDILNLNKIESVKANNVAVKKINKYGFLSNFDFEDRRSPVNNIKKSQGSKQKFKEKKDIKSTEKFGLAKSITSIPTDLLKISEIPSEGQMAYTSNGTIQLIKSIASGGEGSVFTTNTSYVAKIYKKEKINKRKYEKIKLMLSKKIDCRGLCWPVDIIYNKKKEFIGYLMPKAQGKELQKCLFVKPLLLKKFPHWKKADTVQLCITILEKIQYLHERNIILGDINPMNILVVSPKEVYFVDTDSYQIEGFPCPVGTINYTAPEIQHKNFASFLRSFGNEYFAVATLLFMIMLPGKPPYSQQGGESPIDNIIKMDFSYPWGERSNKKTPEGPWRYIWSHMTYDIKEAFYKSFRKGEEHSTENNRLTTEEWIEKLSYYLELLNSGKFAKQDEMSEELFPTRFKKIASMTYVKCKLCGKEIAEEQAKSEICRECLNKGEIYKCSRCGKEILFSNYHKHIKNSKRHDVCIRCYDYLSETYKNIRCNECGRVFKFTNRDYEFFISKGYDLPKRCNRCKNNESSHSGSTYSSSYSSNNSQSESNDQKRCFVTTAVCEYFNKPDDCYALRKFRGFRDDWLLKEPGGQDIVNEYYKIAPSIVEKLEQSPNKDTIYHELWAKYLSVCLSHIENKNFYKCKCLYISMIDYLKSIYINN